MATYTLDELRREMRRDQERADELRRAEKEKQRAEWEAWQQSPDGIAARERAEAAAKEREDQRMAQIAEDTVDITGIDKAELFRALYNKAKTQGMGFLHYTPDEMTLQEAQEICNIGGNAAGDYSISNDRFNELHRSNLYFDYFKGRVMKVDLSKDELYLGLYNRDNGPGAGQAAIAHLLPPKP